MASTFTLSGDLATLGLTTFATNKVRAHIRSNLGKGDALIDSTAGLVMLGDEKVDVASDGTFSVDLIDTDATDLNVEAGTLRYELVVDYVAGGSLSRVGYSSGWFELNADADISELDLDIPSVTPAWRSAFAAEMEALRDEAVLITGLPGTDAAFAAAVQNTAGVGPLTSAALDAGYARVRPLAGQAVDPATGITWTAHPAKNFAPRSIGVDGRLYFTYLNKTLVRSSDPTLTTNTTGPDFTPKATPNNILWATRTTAGYVVILNDTPSDTAHVMFCPESAGFSTNLDDWTLVQVTKATTHIAIGKPRVIAGTSWLVFGEYVTAVYPSVVRKLWLSKDGGQTWTTIRDSTLTDVNVNSHWHCAVILPSGRIWASQGDGVNSFFGYTDDHENWIGAPLAVTDPLYDGASVYQQPTVLLDMGDVLATAPDRGSFDTGLWATDPDTGRTIEWVALASAEVAHTQYGTGSAQRGKEAYVTFPDQGSGSLTTYILGTGDGGRSWHPVAAIDTTGGTAHGPLVGPDANGMVYLQPTSGTIPTYGTGIMVGTLPVWS